MSILQEAFGNDDTEGDHNIRSVLGAVILVANPIYPSTIATLLGFDIGDVLPLLSSVHSLLILQEGINHPVQPFHKSFPDFIINPAHCINERFCVSPPDQHTELLVGCLKLMNRRLEQNTCRLPDGVINSKVNDLRERAEKHIDQSLQYACRSWHKHLIGTVAEHMPKATPILHQFLGGKLLFWLEVLSILGAVREAVDALEVAAKLLEVCQVLPVTPDEFTEFIHTGYRHHQPLILSMIAFDLLLDSLRSSHCG